MLNMSDSDTDLLPNSLLTFQNRGTTICAKGPGINSTNISSLSFRNNTMTSTMNMPWNTDRPRYAASVYDDRSMYRRERELSPMSLHSASGMQPRNYHHSYYPGGMSSHRSMYNGRSGSERSVMSMRTVDSNTSMSARDIAYAFQNGQFNKFDFKIIKDAYNKYLKTKLRRRVEKKRNIRTFMKGFRRKSGGESGDQASNSSISSDDCRSTRTSRSTYKENMSSCRSTKSTKTDITLLRRTMMDSNMVRDSTESLRQNSFRNMYPVAPPVRDNTIQRCQNFSIHSQRETLKSNLLLPSQRFNRTMTSIISNKSNRLQNVNEDEMLRVNPVTEQVGNTNRRRHSDSEEEIFGNITVMEKSPSSSCKRGLTEDALVPVNKKPKQSSPQKNMPKPKTPKLSLNNSIKGKSDFVFAKPQMPIKKMSIVKNQKPTKRLSLSKTTKLNKSKEITSTERPNRVIPPEQPIEKLISSSQKVVEKLIAKSSKPINSTLQVPAPNQTQNSIPQKQLTPPPEISQLSTTDMSMRPSFIKRKLFTQKVDIAEKNSSSDSLQTDSPQTNIYSKIQKEKNKARKLVISQSCLNRDIGDDSNLLDLIHKVVPREQMNATNVANKSEGNNNNMSKQRDSDKFDVTSVVSTCKDNEDVSDTFTDEEIFGTDVNDKNKTKTNNLKKNVKVTTQEEEKPKQKETKTVQKKGDKTDMKQINNERKEKQPTKQNKVKRPQTTVSKSNSPKLKVAVVKLPTSTNSFKIPEMLPQPVDEIERNGTVSTNVFKGVKSFWDTDAESDIETTPRKINGVSVPVPAIPQSQVLKTHKLSTQNKANIETKENTKSTSNQKTHKLNKSQENMKKSKPVNTVKDQVKDNHQEKSISNQRNKIEKSNLTNKVNENKTSNAKTKKNIDNSVCSEKKDKERTKITKINNNIESPVKHNSGKITLNNNTLRFRPHRTPKVNKCEDSSEQSSINNSTLNMTLRSRQVDSSTSLKSYDGNNSLTKKPMTKENKKKAAKNNNTKAEKTVQSDISFTLIGNSPVTRVLRNRKSPPKRTGRTTRRSDVSFTLLPDDLSLNETKSNRRLLKEIQSLNINSSSFYKSRKKQR